MTQLTQHSSGNADPAVALSGAAPQPSPAQGSVTAQGTLAVHEPGSGKLLGEVRVHSAAQVREVVAASRAAQTDWARRSFEERREVLLRFKDLLLERASELCDHLSRENGKTRNEALFMELLPVADATHFYATRARKLLRDEPLPLHLFPHKKSYLRYYPRGVIGIISPWNHPLSIPTGDAVAALMAGNGVVLKPSEYTPLIAEKIRALFEEAGLPRGLFSVVQGRGDVGAALVNAGVNLVIFTGSIATGRKVNVAAAEQLIPCVLELGGKDPAIVLADADLDSAAKKIAWGAFANSGQTGPSIERVYVHESVAQALTDKLVALTRTLRQGEPNQHEIDVGAMTTQLQVELIQRHLDDARAKGARIPVGGEIVTTPAGARFVQPTVLTNVTHEMAIMRDETFGPMLPLMSFKTEDEAVRLANDSHYGLSAYVFTRDRKKADALANRLIAGTVMHNDALYPHAAPQTPWGGVKQSGLGRGHGLHGLKDLCEVRHVNLERVSFPAFWDYPYSKRAWGTGLRLYRTLLGNGITGKLRALFGKS